MDCGDVAGDWVVRLWQEVVHRIVLVALVAQNDILACRLSITQKALADIAVRCTHSAGED